MNNLCISLYIRHLVVLVAMLCACVGAYAVPRCEIRTFDDFTAGVREINKIMEDEFGYIWLATSNGLYRYDGYDFVNFPFRNVKKLYKNFNGDFWCLVDDRAYVFDHKEYKYIDALRPYEIETGGRLCVKKIRVKDDGSHLTRIVCDNDTCLWVEYSSGKDVIVRGSGVGEPSSHIDKDGNRWALYDDYALITTAGGRIRRLDMNVRFIASDEAGVWILNSDGRLYRYDYRSGKAVNSTSLLPGNVRPKRLKNLNGVNLIQSTDGEVYRIHAHGGVVRVDGCESIDNIYVDTAGRLLAVPDARHFHKDKYGTVWVIKRNGGISCFEGDTLVDTGCVVDVINMRDSHQNFEDCHGNLWLWNLFKMIRLSFSHKPYQVIDDGTTNQTLYVEDNGRYWVADKWQPMVMIYNPDNSLAGYLGPDGRIDSRPCNFGSRVYCICKDRRGTMWLGTKPDGIYRLRPDGDGYDVTNFTPPNFKGNNLNHNEITGIEEDSYGRIWISTYGKAVNCIENPESDNPRFVNCDNGLSFPAGYNPKFRFIKITSDGILFAGTSSGMYVADINMRDLTKVRFKEHRSDPERPDGLGSSSVTGVYETAAGDIYVSTENSGIDRLLSVDKRADILDFRHYSARGGFPTDICKSVFEHDGSLWMVSPNRLIELRNAGLSDETVNMYLANDDLIFSGAVPVCLSDGSYLFGLGSGTMRLDMGGLIAHDEVPDIKVCGVRVNDNGAFYGPDFSEVTLGKDERDLSLYFVSMGSQSPYGVNYAYMIKGYHDTWQYLYDKSRIVSFMNMRPGKYTLLVKSTDCDGRWTDNVREISINVTPKFHETIWAYLLYTLIILMVAYALYRVRRYIVNIKRQQERTLEKYMELLDSMSGDTEGAEAQNSQSVDDGIKFDPADDKFIKDAMKFIDEHLSEPDIYVDEMANALAVSKSLLNKKIKRLLGRTPVDLIREARMKKACLLLKGTGGAVSEIAYACGFSDTRYFNKCFKNATGMSPTEYRSNN